ncbi:hypothetical protein U9M48_032900 [Paspalum notatum var. saurae]|uniref:Reverse transcriptase domain-containing protein n=1 Tax=Paspalum notatum var. saurae TaxID=547442 RepID=A0AAQ3UA86_PASNO
MWMNFVDYAFLPASETRGGILARGPELSLGDVLVGCFTLTVRVLSHGGSEPWWLTAVYGPQDQQHKELFLEELSVVRCDCARSWAILGDFNLILSAEDKNNDCINRGAMRRFRQPAPSRPPLHLEQREGLPTLFRLDKVLVTVCWDELFLNASLQALSTDTSDHSPLLLQTNVRVPCKPRFHFECFWPGFDGFQEAVTAGWRCTIASSDPYCRLDDMFRNLIKALQSWSATRVGLIRDQLAMARAVILKLDQAQELRRLSVAECDLRSTLKHRCLDLSSLSRTIACQRARVRQIAEGDANTRFFHLVARGRKRKIYIPNLMSDGCTTTTFPDMKRVLHNHFLAVFASMPEEVWCAIKDMPSDRAPGPDGFTGAFYKAAWPVIKPAIMEALRRFHAGFGEGFEKLNNGLIVLLPKKEDAAHPGDYRPIAMIHSFGKLVSKLLAARFAPHLPGLVSCNQTAFTRGRTLHDSYKFVQCLAAEFRRKKVSRLLFKIDISKAFDTLLWAFLLEVMEKVGFSARWRGWVSILSSSVSSRVLLNGRPGADIKHLRGVRQGDSLSPMLFIMAIDALNRLFSEAAHRGLVSRPGLPQVRHLCSLYADDFVVFIGPSSPEASAIKRILHSFGAASGLLTNLSKCSVTPINVDDEQSAAVASILECQIAAFPVRYLGLPLSSGALPKSAVHVMVDAVEKRLPACVGPLMARSGRLVWIKSVLMAMPIFAMMANKLPAWARAGSDQSIRGKCLVAWPVVTRPTLFGGLGVPDLKLLSHALQTRWLWLQRASEDRIWSGLPISVASEVREFFEASITVSVRNGRRTLFWRDRWLDGQAIKDFALALVAVIPRRIAKTLTVAEGLEDRAWTGGIVGGLTVAVLEDYVALWAKLDNVALLENIEDKVIWRWTADGQYSTKSAYLMLHQGLSVFPGHELIWKSWLPLRVKLFLWLAVHRRLWTSYRRRRHGLDAREACFLCDDAPETMTTCW